jgi:23S rRNA (uracil1939-C5)-methyltransferase
MKRFSMCASEGRQHNTMVSANDRVELVIDKAAAGGRMLARADGQVILVAGAIPGERVGARIERVAKGVAFAETIAVIDASPDRREPFVDPLCGGSLYSYIAYPRQLTIKAEVIVDAFKRIGRLELPAPVPVAASPEEGYRMRARLHVRGHRLGFFREGTHDICDARATRQLLPATCDVLDRLSAAMRSLGDDVIREIELTENVDASERVVHLDAARPLDARLVDTLTSTDGLTPGPYVTDTLRVGDSVLTLRRHVLAFFQGNRHLLADLVAHVTERVPIGGSLADLYAGVGLFAVAAAVTRGASVFAVEGDKHAADDLHANAAAAGARMTTVRGPVEGFASGAIRALGRGVDGPPVETVIVDPPRTGMSREALDAVLSTKALRVIYVSCDVATLARDARRIVDAGYTIARADAFDLFPNTPHVETVVIFQRS